METHEEVYYLDASGEPCEAEKAASIIIREIDENGELVNETFLVKE